MTKIKTLLGLVAAFTCGRLLATPGAFSTWFENAVPSYAAGENGWTGTATLAGTVLTIDDWSTGVRYTPAATSTDYQKETITITAEPIDWADLPKTSDDVLNGAKFAICVALPEGSDTPVFAALTADGWTEVKDVPPATGTDHTLTITYNKADNTFTITEDGVTSDPLTAWGSAGSAIVSTTILGTGSVSVLSGEMADGTIKYDGRIYDDLTAAIAAAIVADDLSKPIYVNVDVTLNPTYAGTFKVVAAAGVTVTCGDGVTDNGDGTYTYFPAPTTSLGFDGGQGASTVLGGTAPTSFEEWADLDNYVAVRDSDSNKAMRIVKTSGSGSGMADPAFDVPTGFSDETSWAVNFVGKLTSYDAQVGHFRALWGVGGAVWRANGKNMALVQTGNNTISLRLVGGNPQTHVVVIPDVAVMNADRQYHAYTVTYNHVAAGTEEDPRYTLYIDGVRMGGSGTLERQTGYSTNVGGLKFNVGNLFGGVQNVTNGDFTGDGTYVDDFAVWPTTCLSADLVKNQLAAKFNPWPLITEYTIDENTTWNDLEIPAEAEALTINIVGTVSLDMTDAEIPAGITELRLNGGADANLTVLNADNVFPYAALNTLGLLGTVTFPIDATDGFTADEPLRTHIENAKANETFIFTGSGANGATLDYGTDQFSTSDPFGGHLVFQDGTHTMIYKHERSDSKFGKNASSEKPTVLVTGENTSLTINGKNLCGWVSNASVATAVIRVNDTCSLNLVSNNYGTGYWAEMLYIEPGATVNLNTGTEPFNVNGGASEAAPQVFVPASDGSKTANITFTNPSKMRVINQGTVGAGFFVGEGSTLNIGGEIVLAQPLTKYGAGTLTVAKVSGTSSITAADGSNGTWVITGASDDETVIAGSSVSRTISTQGFRYNLNGRYNNLLVSAKVNVAAMTGSNNAMIFSSLVKDTAGNSHNVNLKLTSENNLCFTWDNTSTTNAGGSAPLTAGEHFIEMLVSTAGCKCFVDRQLVIDASNLKFNGFAPAEAVEFGSYVVSGSEDWYHATGTRFLTTAVTCSNDVIEPEEIKPTEAGLVITIAGATIEKDGVVLPDADGTIPNETGVYTVKKGDVTIAEVAVIKVKDAETGDAPAVVTTAVAVPFASLTGGAVTVDTLLNKALLNTGDQLMAWTGSAYNAWQLNGGKAWEGVTVVKGTGDNQVTIATAGGASTTELPHGSAVWVKSAGNVVIYGKQSSSATPTIATGVNLLGNTTMKELALSVESTQANDIVQIPGDATGVRQYTRTAEGWSSMKQVPVMKDGVQVMIGGAPLWRTETSTNPPSVPAGRGYFLKRPAAK